MCWPSGQCPLCSLAIARELACLCVHDSVINDLGTVNFGLRLTFYMVKCGVRAQCVLSRTRLCGVKKQRQTNLATIFHRKSPFCFVFVFFFLVIWLPHSVRHSERVSSLSFSINSFRCYDDSTARYAKCATHEDWPPRRKRTNRKRNWKKATTRGGGTGRGVNNDLERSASSSRALLESALTCQFIFNRFSFGKVCFFVFYVAGVIEHTWPI